MVWISSSYLERDVFVLESVEILQDWGAALNLI